MLENPLKEIIIDNFIISFSTWPRGCVAALSLDVDDIHPQSSNEGLDFSGDMDEGVFSILNRLARELNLRFTLFLTPDWIQRHYKYCMFNLILTIFKICRSYPLGTFRVSNRKYSNWCKWLKDKVSSGFFEVALHGLHHYSEVNNTSQEFIRLSKSECLRRLKNAEQILSESGISYVNGFRPPGWGITNELLQALDERKYLFLAGSTDNFTEPSYDAKSNFTGLRGVSLIYPGRYKSFNFITFTANCNHNDLQRALKIADLGGLILIHTHIASSSSDILSVSEDFYKGVSNMIKKLESRFLHKIWYAKLSDIAKWWIARENIDVKLLRYEKGEIMLSICNQSPYPADGLSINLTNPNKERLPIIFDDLTNGYLLDEYTICLNLPPQSGSVIKVRID